MGLISCILNLFTLDAGGSTPPASCEHIKHLFSVRHRPCLLLFFYSSSSFAFSHLICGKCLENRTSVFIYELKVTDRCSVLFIEPLQGPNEIMLKKIPLTTEVLVTTRAIFRSFIYWCFSTVSSGVQFTTWPLTPFQTNIFVEPSMFFPRILPSLLTKSNQLFFST